MSKHTDGVPAFLEHLESTNGMTLRDWLAGQAMQALIAKSPFIDSGGYLGARVDRDGFRREIAASAYGYADAMIKERKK